MNERVYYLSVAAASDGLLARSEPLRTVRMPP